MMVDTFDWLISDIRMPRMDGIDLATQARRLQPHLGMILMTADDVSAEERRRIAECGAELLIKPVTADRLVDAYVKPRRRANERRGAGC